MKKLDVIRLENHLGMEEGREYYVIKDFEEFMSLTDVFIVIEEDGDEEDIFLYLYPFIKELLPLDSLDWHFDYLKKTYEIMFEMDRSNIEYDEVDEDGDHFITYNRIPRNKLNILPELYKLNIKKNEKH